MQRLPGKLHNTAQVYDSIFQARRAGPGWDDERRWRRMLEYYDGGRLIDLGCLDSGIGEMVWWQNYQGVDIAANAIEEMNRGRGCYEVGDVYNLRYEDQTFDYAVMGQVIEHLEYPQRAIEEALRVLKSEGILALSTPLEEIREPGAVDLENHIWSFSKEDIKEMTAPHAKKIKMKVLGSRWFPYKYYWPTLIAWITKK